MTSDNHTLRWAVTIRAEDGRHVHVLSYDAACEFFRKQVGDANIEAQAALALLDAGERGWAKIVDDWGRTIHMAPAPHGITTSGQYAAFLRAYDARECGRVTKRQLAILARVEGR